MAVQSIVSKDVEAVVTGECGPKAYESLKEAGIKMYTGVSGSVRDGIRQFKNASLREAGRPTSPPYAGMR